MEFWQSIPWSRRPRAWQTGKRIWKGFLRDFAPASYLETHLVVQLATLSWRKIRVARCEAQVTGAALARSWRRL